MPSNTVIVGGGVAGLSCAMRLLEERQDFLLITENIGGRIMYKQEAKVNMRAYFVMNNYANARQLLTTGSWINPIDACFISALRNNMLCSASIPSGCCRNCCAFI